MRRTNILNSLQVFGLYQKAVKLNISNAQIAKAIGHTTSSVWQYLNYNTGSIEKHEKIKSFIESKTNG